MEDHLKRIAEFSPAKLSLLAKQIKSKKEPHQPRQITKRVSGSDNLPLSYAQKRLWFVEQLNPGNAANNIASATRVKGALNLPAFEQGVKEIVRRHEVLRTRFGTVEGEPVQIIEEEGEIALSIVDLRGLSAQKREREARRLASEEGSRGFDLSTGPMLRVKVVRMDEQEQGVMMTMHHIVSDGWSMGVLVRESGELYESYSGGRASGLKELEIQYADYAIWQREKLKGEMQERELRYWKKQLEGAPSTLELPTDRTRPSAASFRGDRISIEISPSLTESLREINRAEGATMFMMLLAAFNVLLFRYSWQERIVVGTGIANRNRVEIEGLIGFFVNLLALHTDLSGNPGFLDLLRRVRQVCLDAFANQDLPFDKLVEELRPGHRSIQTPLFQVMFFLQNAAAEKKELSGLRVDSQERDIELAHFDLLMFAQESGKKIVVGLEYSTDIFNRQTISSMLEHFRTILEEVAPHPETKLLNIPILRKESGPTPQIDSVVIKDSADRFYF